jgi:hypothetical protein
VREGRRRPRKSLALPFIGIRKEPLEPGEGVFIAFAAAAGKKADDNPTGRNGLFTQYLLEVARSRD